MTRLFQLFALTLFILPTQPACGADQARPKRIVSEADPHITNPMTARWAEDVGTLERKAEEVAQNQEKLKTGQIKQEDYDKSIADSLKLGEQIAAKNPESAPIHTSVARLDIQAGQYPKAIEHATTAIGLAPKDPFPLTTRGLAYYQSGDFASANADAKRALALDPADTVAKAIYELSKDRVPGDGGSGLKNSLTRAGRDVVSMPESPFASAAGAEAAASPARSSPPSAR